MGLQSPRFEEFGDGMRVTIYRNSGTVEKNGDVSVVENQANVGINGTDVVENAVLTVQKTKGGGLKSEKGGLKSEKGGQKTEKGGQKTEKGGPKTEEGALKPVTSKTAVSIIKLMQNNFNITVSDIVNHLSIARSAVMKHIKRLKDQGLIERIGPDKGGHWEVLIDE